MLTDSPAVRSASTRLLFLVSAITTAAILLWMHPLRLNGLLQGMTGIFFVLFAYGDYGATICALLILAAAVLIPVGVPLRRIIRWAGAQPGIVAIASFVALCAGTLLVYHNHPLSMDEYTAYFQSRVFAAGHLTGHFPPSLMDWLIPSGFQNYFLNVAHDTGRVASAYWPAHSLILTPFTLLGIPWACNPLLSALTALVIHRLALHIFADLEAAGMALLLTVASPVFFGNGISYYSMPAHLLANSLYALLLLRPTVARAFTAGLVGSVALTLHNPVPHMLFAIPWLFWLARRKDAAALVGAACLGYFPLCVVLGIGWFWFSVQLVHEGASATDHSGLAEGMLRVGSAFTLPDGAILIARLIGLAKIWIWAVPGLLVLACAGARRYRDSEPCRLLTWSMLATLAGYFFVPADQGHGWGSRYFHSAWVSLPILATAALYRPAGMIERRSSQQGEAAWTFDNAETKSYVAACIVLTLIFGLGVRASQMQNFLADDLNQLPHYAGTEPRVVIVDNRLSFYGADLVQNDPWLRGDEIRMISHGRAADQQMMARYYPALHVVFADHYGWVWSAKPLSMPKTSGVPRP